MIHSGGEWMVCGGVKSNKIAIEQEEAIILNLKRHKRGEHSCDEEKRNKVLSFYLFCSNLTLKKIRDNYKMFR